MSSALGDAPFSGRISPAKVLTNVIKAAEVYRRARALQRPVVTPP